MNMAVAQSLLGSVNRSTKPAPLILPDMNLDIHKQFLAEAVEKPTDFCIKVENQTIDVHTSVLCAVSDYFRAMLESGMKETNEGVLHNHYTRADVVKTMIGYFYGKRKFIEWEHIRDYVDIVELWQISALKVMLEAYISENISLDNCLDWFMHMSANAYQMEHVKQNILDLINSQFIEISKCKEFKSLSLSNLISVIKDKDIIHNSALLEGCIAWALADESFRKPAFGILISHIRFTECNPAYLKHILDIYDKTLLTDQATRAKINEVISSSFILIGLLKGYSDQRDSCKKVFCVNMTSCTVSEIGKCPDELAQDDIVYCFTDSGIFCGGGRKGVFERTSQCSLLDLVTLKITSLPSFPEHVSRGGAVAMGNKVFMISGQLLEFNDIQCLDLQDKHWATCTPREIPEYASAACVDSFIFVLLYNGKLQSYNTEGNSWSHRADPPFDKSPTGVCAVVVRKDIYFVAKYTDQFFRYSTSEDKWVTIAKPPGLGYHMKAVCVKEKLVLYDYCKKDFWLAIYDSASHTWEAKSLKLPSSLWTKFACTV